MELRLTLLAVHSKHTSGMAAAFAIGCRPRLRRAEMRHFAPDSSSSLLVGATVFHVHALGANTDIRRARASPPSSPFISCARCREAVSAEWVACKLSWCWREEGLGVEDEEQCWKNAGAAAGSSALHSGVTSVIASMLLSIQPCSSEARASEPSGRATVRTQGHLPPLPESRERRLAM